MYCTSCGTENAAESTFCARCGAKFGQPATATAPPPVATMQPAYAGPAMAAAGAPARSSTMALVGLITGILGFIMGPLLSILGIVFGVIGNNEIKKNPGMQGAGFAKAGIICGIVSLVLWVIGIIAWVGFYAWAVTTYGY